MSLPASPLLPTSPALAQYAGAAGGAGSPAGLYAHAHHVHSTSPGVSPDVGGMAGAGALQAAPVLVQKVKGPWRPEEDAILTQLVAKLGPRRWTVIASHIPGRTGKQARERWLNQLSPDLVKRPWTAEEDRIVMQAHARLGNRWSEIAKLLKGRTDNATKNRFNTTIRRQISEMAGNVAIGRGGEVDEVAKSGRDDEAGSVVTTCESPDGNRRGKRKLELEVHSGHERLPQRSKTLTASSC